MGRPNKLDRNDFTYEMHKFITCSPSTCSYYIHIRSRDWQARLTENTADKCRNLSQTSAAPHYNARVGIEELSSCSSVLIMTNFQPPLNGRLIATFYNKTITIDFLNALLYYTMSNIIVSKNRC